VMGPPVPFACVVNHWMLLRNGMPHGSLWGRKPPCVVTLAWYSAATLSNSVI
jgi:hypothetical protein